MVLSKTEDSFLSDDELNSSMNRESESCDDNVSVSASDDDQLVDDSSDSSPEEVGFKDEEEKSKLLRKRAWQQIKSQRDQIKRKRTEIHIRNVKQKTEKKKISRELPNEILQSLDTSANVSELSSLEEPGVSSFKEVEPSTAETEKEFISIHGPTIFKVKNLEKEMKKPKPIPEEAANFRNRILFGRKVQREKSTRDYFAKLEKQKVGGKR